MFELIASEDMREYLQKIGCVFTDRQKATIIYNSNQSQKEIMNSLHELKDQTEDDNIRKQITERIEFEKNKLIIFKNNHQRKYVYVVIDQNYPCGYFKKYETALKYVKKLNIECEIRKQLIVDEDIELVKSSVKVNPNVFLNVEVDNLVEYTGDAVARMHLKDGCEIYDLYSLEMEEEYEKIVDEFKVERFENQFINIPYYFDISDCVKDIRSGEYGIVVTKKEKWNKFIQRIDGGIYVDWSDMSIEVMFLTDKGTFYHSHINPIYLESKILHIDDDRCKPLKELSRYLIGVGSEENVLLECRKYAKNKRKYDIVDKAKKLEDIIF